MDLQTFQALCAAVLAVAYAVMFVTTPRGERRRLLVDVLVIAVASWLAEETAILRYRFYAYPDWWWLKLDELPFLVIAIWPVVILSSRAVIDRLWPGLGGLRLALAVGLAVTVDATLIETISADARLWRWVEGGYLGVPLIGMLGWGAFAFAITWSMELKVKRFALSRALAPVLALALTHLLLVGLWWGGFRFVLRGALPAELVYGVFAASAVLSVLLFRRRGQGRMIPPSVALTRILASSVFVVLLADSDTPETWALWLHLGAVALPYLATVDWRALTGSRPSPAA
jgi:hypothetical protein